MKLKLLIMFLILVCMDFACSEGCNNETYNVIAINDILVSEILPNGISKPVERDSIPFDSFFFKMNFVEKLLTYTGSISLINISYARDPCHPPETTLRLDSVKIFSMGNNQVVDVTNHFTLNERIIDNSNDFIEKLFHTTRDAGFELYFKLTKPPVQIDTLQFNFQFYQNNKMLFEKMSSPLIITP